MRRKGYIQRRTSLKRFNPERVTKRRAKAFGPQAELCRRLPCLACGYPPPSDPAHVRSRGAGGGDRGNVLPLCREHHSEQHTVGWARMERLYSFDVKTAAGTIETAAYGPGGEE